MNNPVNVKNVISKKRETTAAKIIEAIKSSTGLLTLAASKAGVSYMTLWRYTQDFPSVKEAVEEAKETMLDFAEGKLYQNIREGDTPSILFYLKTQGKKRGYIERQEISGKDGGPIRLENSYDLTDEQLTVIAARGRPRALKQAPGTP